MQRRHLLIQMLRQRIDLALILGGIGPEFDLREYLIGERSRHHEGRMARGIAQIHQAAFRQQDDALLVGEFDFIHLRLHIIPLHIPQPSHLNFGIEMADVADNGAMLHGAHVINRDHIHIACRSHKDICHGRGLFHGDDLIAFHGGLQGADGVNFAHHHAAAGIAERGGRTLAHITKAANHGDLAGHHHIGAATDRIHQ